MKGKRPVLLALMLLALASAVVALGACSEDATEAMIGETQSPTTTSLGTTTVLPQTTTETAASTTTAVASSPMTTELPAGATLLENGNVQVDVYVFNASAVRLLEDGGPFLLHGIPTALLTDEEYEAAILQELDLPAPDPREVAREFMPTASFTVSTLGEIGEQAISLEQFLSIWSASPPEGGEHLAHTLWSIEYSQDSTVVSITEVAP